MSENKDLKSPEERAHAVLSASGSHRWIDCVGSSALATIVDPTLLRGQSMYAAEGSAAHFLCEHCIETGKPAKQFKGMKIVPEGPLFPKTADDDDIKAETGHTFVFKVDDEMIKAVQEYVDYIQAIVKSIPRKCTVHIEISGNLDELWEEYLDGEQPEDDWLRYMFGTSDCVIECMALSILHIVDFKYGAGIAVDPDKNPQLMYYAAAFAGNMLGLYSQVTLHIVQPRAFHAKGTTRSWTCDGQDIYDYFMEVALPAAEANVDAREVLEQVIQDIQDGVVDEEYLYLRMEEFLNPTQEACQWCVSVHNCPKIKNAITETARSDFGAGAIDVKNVPMPTTADELQNALGWVPVLEKWCKQVRAAADNFTLNGHEIPGFKRVAKRATRKYTDEEEAIALLKKKRIKKALYLEEKLLTPAQMEKMLEREGFDPSIIEPVTFKDSSGTTVVPESDKRAAVRIRADADFEDEDDLTIPGK